MKHTLSVLVEDESGVLTRIAGLFARRGFNIESLAVGPAEQYGVSRITMVIPGDINTIEQLTKQHPFTIRDRAILVFVQSFEHLSNFLFILVFTTF